MSYIQPVQIKFIHSDSHETAMIMTKIDAIPRVGEVVGINNHINGEANNYKVIDVKYSYIINEWDNQYLATIYIYI